MDRRRMRRADADTPWLQDRPRLSLRLRLSRRPVLSLLLLLLLASVPRLRGDERGAGDSDLLATPDCPSANALLAEALRLRRSTRLCLA